MTTPGTRAAIDLAMTNSRQVDVIDGIKAAIIRDLETLDPASEISVTDYFNHSFIPDMVVRWSERGQTEERPVYLRFTLRSTLLGQDVPALSSTGPIVLTLREDATDEASRARVRRDVESSPRLLLTEVPALDAAVSTATGGVRDRPDSPLLELVRKNIVRGARGVLDSSTMQSLTDAADPTVDGNLGSASTQLGEFNRIVESVFLDDAALRLRRSSDILRVGLSENADEILLADSADRPLLQGQLSNAELTTLLPYLLSRPDVTRSRVFWSQVGAMMNLDRLEEMAAHLGDLKLDPLVLPNLSTWTASRAYLGSVAEDEELVAGSEAAGWTVEGGFLTLTIAGWKLRVAMTGKRLRGRSGALSARWLDLAPSLRGYDLTRVRLQSALRTVEIGAADDGDVRSDVVTISDNIEDDFFVPSASVRMRDTSSDEVVTVEFASMLATAKDSTSLRVLSQTALELLGYRYPPNPAELGRLLGAEPSADGDQ